MSWFSTQKYRKELVKDLREAIEKGVAPWQKPWSAVEYDLPRNAISGHLYSGMNVFRLHFRSLFKGYTDPRWLTYRQIQSIGARVKSGEMGTYLIRCVDGGWCGRGQFMPYVVFNAEQVEGIEPYIPDVPENEPVDRCEKAERILRESGAKIKHGGNRAFYRPSGDFIQVPVFASFKTPYDYYATVIHELSHWTGHKSRLNRDFSGWFGTESYAFEELVAEISSMFVSAETGIDQTKEHFDNHAAYVGDWLKVIDKKPNAFFDAVNLAHRAANEVLKHERERERQLDGIIEQEKAG